MAKKVVELDVETGRSTTGMVGRHQKKSEQQLIGWTQGPATLRAKIARSLWG